MQWAAVRIHSAPINEAPHMYSVEPTCAISKTSQECSNGWTSAPEEGRWSGCRPIDKAQERTRLCSPPTMREWAPGTLEKALERVLAVTLAGGTGLIGFHDGSTRPRLKPALL